MGHHHQGYRRRRDLRAHHRRHLRLALAALSLLLATCRDRPEPTASDALLADALRARGVAVLVLPWDLIDPADPAVERVCLRSTWDYFTRFHEFRPWVERFLARPGVLLNPAPTVLWNADKAYLEELGRAGIALPLTRWFAPGVRPDADAFLDEHGLDRAVIKPRVSGTAYGTHVMTPGRRLTDDEWRPLEENGSLLQAFVPEIAEGEVSLIHIGGRFSHAVRKVPRAGDFRVQSEFGGRVEPFMPRAPLAAFGERVLAAAGHPWVYARVDVVETGDGPVLMELEVIEPDLFLGTSAGAAGRLADVLMSSSPW